MPYPVICMIALPETLADSMCVRAILLSASCVAVAAEKACRTQSYILIAIIKAEDVISAFLLVITYLLIMIYISATITQGSTVMTGLWKFTTAVKASPRHYLYRKVI